MGGFNASTGYAPGRETGRVAAQTGVIRCLAARAIVSAFALSRRFVSVRVRFTQGLLIRRSRVRNPPGSLASSTTTYAASTRPRRELPLGDILGDSRRGRFAFGGVR
jgi:hypothetical protein